MTSSIRKIALIFFLSNRNLQNRSIMFQKTSVSEIYGLMLFLTRPKFSAISRRGSNFFILPNSLFSKVE